jgi:chorismate synthase
VPALTYLTAGESHGPAIVAVVSGLPAGLPIDTAFINEQLRRRQGGYGRSARQRIEHDSVEILSGLRAGRAIGSPMTLLVRNRDCRLDDPARTPPVHTPRPGHADLAGALKYATDDCRSVLERASARETAGRVAAGAVARLLLRSAGIETFGFVRAIGGVRTDVRVTETTWRDLLTPRDASETYCPDSAATARQIEAIHKAKTDRDTLGGVIEVHVFGCPPGLGSPMQWTERLDARLAAAAMGVQAIKAVEIGLGMTCAEMPGSAVHDPIRSVPTGSGDKPMRIDRGANNAGGIEGGMSNGSPIVLRAAMKPISTLLQGMPSVDLRTGAPAQSAYERSDVCAVPAASVVVEHAVAFEVARCFLEKFGGDTLEECLEAYRRFVGRPIWPRSTPTAVS